MHKLTLASKSPRRKRILEENNIVFETFSADIDEESYEDMPPLNMVLKLSEMKAKKAAEIIKEGIILAADTTVNLNGKVVSKPLNLSHAFDMLKSLSGSNHEVITAYTIIDVEKNKTETGYEITKVFFNDLTDEEINEYINSIDVLGFAGSYGIQDGADKFVKRIDGDLLNVVGLPSVAVEKIKKYIK